MEELVVDIAAEGLCIGCLYNSPELFDEYGDRIDPRYDFTDDAIKFLYGILSNCWLQNGKINDIALNVYINALSDDDKRLFNELGGLHALRRFGNVAEKSVDNFDRVVTKLKTFNTLRALQRKNICVLPYIEKFKNTSADYVLKVYETMLNQIAICSSGTETPKPLSEGIAEFIQSLEKTPDIGYDTPFNLINYYTRGIRPKTITCLAAGTNQGKTRILTNLLLETSIKNKNRALLISTEQTEEEMKLQFCTAICNNLIIENPKDYINESDIAKGLLKEKQKEYLSRAIKYFEEKCNVDFMCASVYDLSTLKKLIKQAKLKTNCRIVCIDVMKPWRDLSIANQNLSEWQVYAYAVEQLRALAVQLDLACIFTSQLTPQSMESGNLEISSIAIGTHIAFVLDTILMFRDIRWNELQKWKIKIDNPNHAFNGNVQSFDTSKHYMMGKVVKNRSGEAGAEVVFEADKGQCRFVELGRLIKN